MTVEEIQEFLNRVPEEPYHVIFYITVPYEADSRNELLSSESIKKVIDILNKNNVKYDTCDTVPGAFNLNQDWIETDIFDATVEFCGVYPINWNINDVIQFVELIEKGKIIVNVDWYDKEGNFVAQNH